ncbi:hypothetical protein [Sphingomonas sp. SAFR-052]|uniref:hypothetical protein n=1 Tax=Sphingomonas sp. SAFR-052 TaxID=3436867 RepID=UPI003F816A78
MAFDPKNLKPAVRTNASATSDVTARDELLAVIETQLALFAYPKAIGQRLYEVQDNTVTFSLRYGGKALTLLPNETKVAVPKDQFVGALEHYKAEAGKGAFDAQLEKYGAASASRKASAKATRESKKAAANK